VDVPLFPPPSRSFPSPHLTRLSDGMRFFDLADKKPINPATEEVEKTIDKASPED